MPVKVSEIEAVVVAEHHLLAQNLRAILARRLALFNTVELERRRAGIGRGRARIGRVGHGALARSPREAGLGLRRRRRLECDQRDHIGHVGGRGHVAVPAGSFGAGLSSAARAAGVAGGFGGVAAGVERGEGRGVAVW